VTTTPRTADLRPRARAAILSPMSLVWYFAYGSNMNSGTFRGRRGIEYARAIPTRAPGWRLVLDKSSVFPLGETFANIVPDPPTETLGVAFEIDESELVQIDWSEAVPLGSYQRIEIEVAALTPMDDGPSSAFTLTSDKRAARPSPSLRYMQLVIAGAIDDDLPAEWVEMLRAVPAYPETRAARLMRKQLDRFMKRRKR
jgi:hypothetical protein